VRAMLLLLCVLAVGCGQAGNTSPTAATAKISGEAAPGFALAMPAEDGVKTEGAPPSASLLERKIIYTASVDLVVEDFSAIPTKVTDLVQRYDGFIAKSQVSGDAGESRSGRWTLRIPILRFDAFLQEAQGQLGEVKSLSRDSQDVSEEFFDVEARIQNKRQEESRIIKLLAEQTGTLEEVLRIERELSRVREEIERFEGRKRVLSDLTSLTTITLRIDEARHFEPELATTFGDRIRRAFDGSIWTMQRLGENLAVVLVAAGPWLVLLGIPALLYWRLARRRRPSAFL
jgi:hypothetical protein